MYAPIAKELAQVKDEVILDGEVVIENEKGISDFQLLQNYPRTKKRKLYYYVFDILYLNGHSTTGFPLFKRKELLSSFFEAYSFRNIIEAPYNTSNGQEYFEQLIKDGQEGVIAKEANSLYHPGVRTEKWYKVKKEEKLIATIAGYTLPLQSRLFFGSLILGEFVGGGFRYIGNCGTGFSDAQMRDLFDQFEKLIIPSHPFEVNPKLNGVKGKPVWIKPILTCTVKFLERTEEGLLRNPVFISLHKKPVGMKKAKAKTTRRLNSIEEGTIQVNRKPVKLTNVDKVYWPDDGYTKGDLITYYRSVQAFILPYLKNRPISLLRHPNGIHGKSFYQKDMDIEQIPDWIKTEKIYSPSRGEDIDYFICNNETSLVYLANLGCIEINPWHSTYLKPDHPTYLILDLDPADIPFTAVVDTALAIKEICDQVEISCYCKTSGATGLHVYIPLAGRYDDEQVKIFARLLASLTHEQVPNITSIERRTDKRKDKVYVDFLQNRKGQTIAAAYSVRPRPGAPVSTPLRWKEVKHSLNPSDFHMFNTIRRLERTGDLWTDVIRKTTPMLTVIKNLEKVR